MYSRKTCTVPGCSHRSLPGTDLCADHCGNFAEMNKQILDHIGDNTAIREVSFPGVYMNRRSFKAKQLLNCDFSYGKFEDCIFDDSILQFVVLNHSVFHNCSFKRIRAIECIFACSSFHSCDFSGSDLVQNNFNGSAIIDGRFNSSDLMYSRFINADLQNCDFVDCNLKAVMFPNSIMKDVSFKYSNREEAIFEFEQNETWRLV